MDDIEDEVLAEVNKDLTNEKLRGKFPNQFDMVNCAIRFAREAIYSKRPSRVNTDSQNVAFQIVQELVAEPLGSEKIIP